MRRATKLSDFCCSHQVRTDSAALPAPEPQAWRRLPAVRAAARPLRAALGPPPAPRGSRHLQLIKTTFSLKYMLKSGWQGDSVQVLMGNMNFCFVSTA